MDLFTGRCSELCHKFKFTCKCREIRLQIMRNIKHGYKCTIFTLHKNNAQHPTTIFKLSIIPSEQIIYFGVRLFFAQSKLIIPINSNDIMFEIGLFCLICCRALKIIFPSSLDYISSCSLA